MGGCWSRDAGERPLGAALSVASVESHPVKLHGSEHPHRQELRSGDGITSTVLFPNNHGCLNSTRCGAHKPNCGA